MPDASRSEGVQAIYGVPPKLSELAAKLGLQVSELTALQKEIEAGKSRLWRAHKKIVFKLAHQYNTKGGLPVPDLIMVGSFPWSPRAVGYPRRVQTATPYRAPLTGWAIGYR